jgi:Fe-S cluster assembly ATP-binding protein
MTLKIEDLHVRVAGAPERDIVRGLNLEVAQGEVHAVMGPNASGKSTLAHAIMGKPGYQITQGRLMLNGEEITHLPTEERAKRGIFLAMQYPVEIPGVNVGNFLRAAYNQVKGKNLTALEFRLLLRKRMQMLEMDPSFAERYLNQGFSGGEKKRNEILQMAVLEPRIAVLDETDSGLDIDALKAVSNGINALAGPQMGILLITHYQRILNYVEPQFVHVLVNGRIVKSGGKELAQELERSGYEAFRENSQ